MNLGSRLTGCQRNRSIYSWGLRTSQYHFTPLSVAAKLSTKSFHSLQLFTHLHSGPSSNRLLLMCWFSIKNKWMQLYLSVEELYKCVCVCVCVCVCLSCAPGRCDHTRSCLRSFPSNTCTHTSACGECVLEAGSHQSCCTRPRTRD